MNANIWWTDIYLPIITIFRASCCRNCTRVLGHISLSCWLRRTIETRSDLTKKVPITTPKWCYGKQGLSKKWEPRKMVGQWHRLGVVKKLRVDAVYCASCLGIRESMWRVKIARYQVYHASLWTNQMLPYHARATAVRTTWRDLNFRSNKMKFVWFSVKWWRLMVKICSSDCSPYVYEMYTSY